LPGKGVISWDYTEKLQSVQKADAWFVSCKQID